MPKTFDDHHIFQESYYEHNCVVESDKDILDTDILGDSYLSILKRWWYDLFLLSYSHHMAREVYFSSNAMRMARIRQFQDYRGRIHPMSKFRKFWNHFIFITFVLLKFGLPHSTTMFYRQHISTYYVLAGLEIFLILDIYINMKTGYYDEKFKEVILDTRSCLIQLSSTKLFIYVASATPLHWLMLLRYGNNISCTLCKANVFICCLRFMGLFSIYRIYEISTSWKTSRNCAVNYNNWIKFIRIFIILIMTLRQLYNLNTNIKLLLYFTSGQLPIDSYLGRLIVKKFAGDFEVDLSNLRLMAISIGRILKALLLFNYNYASDHYGDMLTILSIYFCAQLFYLWAVFELIGVFNQYMYPEDQHMRFRTFTNNILSVRQLPDKLSSKVDQYFAFKPCLLKLTEKDNKLYKSLPDVLKREIVSETYMKHLQKLPYFKEWPFDIMEDVTVMMKRELFSADDVIVEAGQPGAGLMIVDMGVLAVYTEQCQETDHLIDGDSFGEVSLVTDKEISTSYVVAVTPCVVCVIEKQEFRKYMKQYPDLFYQLKAKIKEKYKDVLLK